MPAFSTLHNELRLRIPNKPYELYDDVIRQAITRICVKTAIWKVITTFDTEADVSTYDLDLPTDSVIHSNLYMVQKGNTDRIVKRPTNGFKVSNLGTSDYLKAFKTVGNDQILITPVPNEGGVTMEVHTAVKPTSSATSVDNDKFFNEYKATVIHGALSILYEDAENVVQADRRFTKFNNGISSIHTDVLKENADTPFKLKVGF